MKPRMTLAMIACVAACHPQRGPAPPLAAPAPVTVTTTELSEWPTTLAAAQRAHEAGDFDQADQALLQFGLKHAGTPEGAESDFWRAVIKADPTNAKPAARERMALFDAYLAAGPGAPRYLEALTYRRLLEAMDSTRTFIAQLRSSAESRQRAREDEIRKLGDDLDRALAELDRIKKRLAPVKPGPDGESP